MLLSDGLTASSLGVLDPAAAATSVAFISREGRMSAKGGGATSRSNFDGAADADADAEAETVAPSILSCECAVMSFALFQLFVWS